MGEGEGSTEEGGVGKFSEPVGEVYDTRPHPRANDCPEEWPRIDLNTDLRIPPVEAYCLFRRLHFAWINLLLASIWINYLPHRRKRSR
jgi:hypothetical protein